MHTSKACNIISKYTAFVPVDLSTSTYLPPGVAYTRTGNTGLQAEGTASAPGGRARQPMGFVAPNPSLNTGNSLLSFQGPAARQGSPRSLSSGHRRHRGGSAARPLSPCGQDGDDGFHGTGKAPWLFFVSFLSWCSPLRCLFIYLFIKEYFLCFVFFFFFFF